MTKDHADLIARAERILRGEYIVSEDGYPEGGEADMRLIRDLRDALVAANAKIARVTDAVDDVLADANEATNPVRRGGMRAAVVEIQIALADEAAHQPLEDASEQPLLTEADTVSTSLAARGSNEAAPSWLKKEIARTDALIAAIPGGQDAVARARVRAEDDNRDEAEASRREADRCDNPLRPEITCAMLVRDNDHLRKRAAELEALLDARDGATAE
jgi:hypothetical protein